MKITNEFHGILLTWKWIRDDAIKLTFISIHRQTPCVCKQKAGDFSAAERMSQYKNREFQQKLFIFPHPWTTTTRNYDLVFSCLYQGTENDQQKFFFINTKNVLTEIFNFWIFCAWKTIPPVQVIREMKYHRTGIESLSISSPSHFSVLQWNPHNHRKLRQFPNQIVNRLFNKQTLSVPSSV